MEGLIIIFAVPIIYLVFHCFRIVPEYERLVVFRLGRVIGVKGPGLVLLLPIIDSAIRVNMRTVTMDVPDQDVITKDNISITVNAVVYIKVVDPQRAVLQVDDYYYATSQLAQTILRSVVGEVELDELLANREKINQKIQTILDEQTDPWGVKVTAVEIKKVDLPAEMQRAMAKQAEAERERRGKIIMAEGELQAAKKLLEAANLLGQSPLSIQLRYLQTIQEVAASQSNTIILPLPLNELLKNISITEK